MMILNKIRFIIFQFLANCLPQGSFFKIRAKILNIAGIKMGSNVRVAGKFYSTNSNMIIGDNVWIGYNFKAYFNPTNKIIIENNVDIAPEVILCCGSHEIGTSNNRAGKGFSRDIKICSGCWIGIRTTILGGSYINEGCIIAGNSFVNGRIEKNIMVGGVPARKIKNLNN